MSLYHLLKALVVTVIFILFIVAYTPNPSSKDISVKNNIEELSRLIKLPFSSKSVQWQLLQSGSTEGGMGPDDWGIVAIIKFSDEDKQKIIDQAASVNIDPVFARSWLLEWFPTELRTLWSDTGGETLRLTVKAKDASLFFSSPLQNGFFIPFGGDGHLLLYLFTQ